MQLTFSRLSILIEHPGLLDEPMQAIRDNLDDVTVSEVSKSLDYARV